MMLETASAPHLSQAPSAPSNPDRHAAGALTALALIGGGICLGLAHLHAWAWPIAWLGLILTAWGMVASPQRLWPSLGLLFGGLFGHWLGHPWYFDAAYNWGGGSWSPPITTLVWFLATLIPIVLPERLLLLALLQWPGRLRYPVWIWFPLAWFGGEQLNLHFAALMQGSFLFTQWQSPPVLKALGHFGWAATTLLCTGICAWIAVSACQRRWRRMLAGLISPALLWLLPSLSHDYSALKGVAAVHMANYQEPPVWSPAGTRLMIWPEVIRQGRPRITEGPVTGLRLEPPLTSSRTYHLFGQETRTAAGFHNSLLTMAPNGQVLGTRSKRLLFRLAERDLFGYVLPGRFVFEPGKRSPMLEVNGLRVSALLCLEAFDSQLALEGKRAGAQLVSLSAIDHDMRESDTALEQLLGATVLLAVESGLPAVRASLFGMAALIAPDGTILRASQPGQSGVLTLDGDWPAHIRRPVRRSHNRPALTRSFKRRRVPSIGAGKARPEKLSPT